MHEPMDTGRACVRRFLEPFAPPRGAEEVSMGKKAQDAQLTITELKKRKADVSAVADKIRGQFPEAKRLAKGDRRASVGKIGEKEAAGLRGVIDAMEVEPAVFGILADEDEGHDPNKLETDLLRDRLDRHQIYSEMAAELQELADRFSDAALSMGALVKPVCLAAYEIAKPLSRRHPAIREKIAPMLDYYSRNAEAAAAARRENKGEKDEE